MTDAKAAPITPERWGRIKAVFQSAVDLTPAERPTFLAGACTGDDPLREEVERLLAVYDETGSFMDSPVGGLLPGTAGAMRTEWIEPEERRPARSPTPRTPSRRGAAPANTFAPGDIVDGRYKIVRFIAEGGMGEVYEAEDLALHGRVALKTIRSDIAEDARTLERFKREIHMARKVTHPNVSRIYDLGTHSAGSGTPDAPARDVLFLTMELLAGESLADRIARERRLATADALPIVAQISAGLAAAHAIAIVHRDFKSGNVMLVADAHGGTRAVITDFGLARQTSAEDGLASISDTGAVVGTPAYMAPEQIQGLPVTAAADIYALGVVMYEMVTGQRPFEGGSVISVAVKRLTEAPRAPRAVVPDLDPAWEAAILKCLERDPVARFASVADVANALGAGITPTPSRMIRPALRVGKSARVRQAIAALIVAGAVIAGYTVWRSRGAPTPAASMAPNRRSVTVLAMTNVSGRPESAWLSTALAEMLTSDLASGGLLRLVPTQEVARIERDLGLGKADERSKEVLGRIRRSLGADFAVVGSFTVLGDGTNALLRVDLSLYDARTGDLRAQSSANGTQGQLFDLVSRAGAPLREKLGLTAKTPAQAVEIAATLPSDAAAAKFYAQGLALLRTADALAARDVLEKAVAAQPKHPLPHAALADAWSLLGYDGKAEQEARQAVAQAGVLPPELRLGIEARAHEFAKDWTQAVNTYRSLFEAASDSVEIGLRLADAQVAAGQSREALVTLAALRRLPAPISDDARIDLSQARASAELSDFKAERESAAAAARKASALGARLLLARARSLEAHALGAVGETAPSTAALEEARRLYEDAGDQRGLARTLNEMAIALSGRGDLAGARRLFERSLQIARTIGDKATSAATLHNLGSTLLDQGQPAEAQKRYDEALGIYREIGARADLSDTLNDIGARLQIAGDLAGALKRYQEALAIDGEVGDKRRTALALANIGELLLVRGELKQAQDMHEESLALAREIGQKEVAAYDLYRLGVLFTARGDLRVARQKHEEAMALQVQLGDKVAVAQTRLGLARLALEENRAGEAESLAREAEEVLRSQDARDAQAFAQGVLAAALLAEARIPDARKAADQAVKIAGQGEDRTVRLTVAVWAAEVRAAGGSPADVGAAVQALETARTEAERIGFVLEAYEARLATAGLQLASGRSATARPALKALAKEADAKGFGLVSRKATALLGG